MRSLLRVAGRVVILAGILFTIVAPVDAGADTLLGAGSTFAALEYSQWRSDAAKAPLNLAIDYQSQGSGYGRTTYLTGAIDFGVTDIQLQSEDQQDLAASSRKSFVYVPTTAGGLAIAFSINGTDGRKITALKANQRNICRIMTEEGMKWNDPDLVAENPGVPLPDTPIARTQRSESAGETYLFSSFCIATAPDVWAKFVQLARANSNVEGFTPELGSGAPTSKWPTGVPTGTGLTAGADNVANQVQTGQGVAFMAYGYAKVRSIPVFQVKNSAGVYLLPNPFNVSVALAYAVKRDDGTFKLTYTATDPDAYFPSTYSYAIAQTDGFSPAKGQVLSSFLYYAVTKGQQSAEKLGYCRLSTYVVQLALDKASQIPGAGPPPTDLAGAPPPPRGGPTGVVPSGGGSSAGAGAAGGKAGSTKAGSTQAGSTKSGGKAGAGVGGTGAAAAGATGAVGAATAGGATVEGATTENTATTLPDSEKLDLSTIEAAGAVTKARAPQDPVSNKDTLWYFLLGFVLLAAGMSAGMVSSGGAKRGREGSS